MVYKIKICNYCKEEYLPTNGRQLVCIKCKNKHNYNRIRNWVLNNKEKALLYQREYRKKHLEKFREKDKLFKRKKRKKNPEYDREIQSRWRFNNQKKHREQSKIWRKNNMEYVIFMNIQRRTKLKKVKGKHSFKEWNSLKEKYQYTCPCCKRKEPDIKLTEDHIIPISKGGDNNITNIQPLCGQCNCKKHTKTIKYASAL